MINESWIQIFALFIANSGLILWFRSESRSDWRHMDNQVKAIHDEMKDFHGRLERHDAEFKAHLMHCHKE